MKKICTTIDDRRYEKCKLLNIPLSYALRIGIDKLIANNPYLAKDFIKDSIEENNLMIKKLEEEAKKLQEEAKNQEEEAKNQIELLKKEVEENLNTLNSLPEKKKSEEVDNCAYCDGELGINKKLYKGCYFCYNCFTQNQNEIIEFVKKNKTE